MRISIENNGDFLNFKGYKLFSDNTEDEVLNIDIFKSLDGYAILQDIKLDVQMFKDLKKCMQKANLGNEILELVGEDIKLDFKNNMILFNINNILDAKLKVSENDNKMYLVSVLENGEEILSNSNCNEELSLKKENKCSIYYVYGTLHGVFGSECLYNDILPELESIEFR